MLVTDAAVCANVSVTRDVICRMRDGVGLASDIYAPRDAEHPLPVLLMRTPYGKRAAQANDVVSYAHPMWFASHGYIVVVQDVRGRYASEGVFQARGNEVEDGYDAVEWCGQLQGSNGAVGMYGMSYGGYVQLAAASARPPSLACIAPGCAHADSKDIVVEGLPRLAFAVSWCLGVAHDEAIRKGAADDALALWQAMQDMPALYGHMPLLEAPAIRLAQKYMPLLRDWLTRQPEDNKFWTSDDLRPADVPALYIAGWYDIWLTESVALFEEHAQRCDDTRLLLGPWAHVPWRKPLCIDCSSDTAEPEPSVNALLLQWFDWKLKGIRPDSWLSSDRAMWYDYGLRRWVRGDFASGSEASLQLGTDGLATVSDSGRIEWRSLQAGNGSATRGGGAPFDVIVDNPLIPTPSVGGWSCCYEAVAPIGPKDQRDVEALSQVAVYTSDPVGDDVPILGRPRLELSVLVDGLPATLVATLCLVRGGRSINIARAVWRCRDEAQTGWSEHRAMLEFSPVALTLGPRDRLRLLLHGSAFPELAVDPHVDSPPAAVARTDVRIVTLVLRPGEDSCLTLPLRNERGEPAVLHRHAG